MSRKTETKRLAEFKEHVASTKYWLRCMDTILATERKSGLTGFHLSVNPTVSATTAEIAKAFCLMYNAFSSGNCIQIYPKPESGEGLDEFLRLDGVNADE